MAFAFGAASASAKPSITGEQFGPFGPIIRSLTPYDPVLEASLRDAALREQISSTLDAAVLNAWETPVVVATSSERSIIGEWDEKAMPDGTLLAGWITSSGGIGCGFKTSHDGGKTWLAAHYADGGSSGGDPVIIPDRSQPGVVYQLCITSSGGTKNVISKSTDSGRTWGAWNGPSWSPTTLDYPMMAARGGKLVMVFNDGGANSNAIVSTNDGQTWSSKKSVSAGWSNCVEEAKDPSIVYMFSGNGGQTLNFESSADYGVTWTSPKSTGISGQSRVDCVTDYNSGDIYAVTESSTAVTVVHTADLGVTWNKYTAFSGSGMGSESSGAYASIAVDEAGKVHVGYISNSGGKSAYYIASANKGVTWSAPVKISGTDSGGSYAHYGHGMAVSGQRVCFGYVMGSSNYYHHTCDGAGGGGPVLARIVVTPDPASVVAGQTVQFTAAGFSANNTPVPITPTWTGTGGTISTAGLYTSGGTIGTYSVEAAVGGIKGTAVVNVISGALASISVVPGSATITADVTQQFTATGKDGAGNTVPITPVWSATGGSVDGSGLYTPDKIGTFDVSAAQSSIKGTGQVTVTPGKPATLKVDPATATVAADSTATFKALATDAKGNDVQVTASWQVSGGTGAGAVSTSGIYTPSKVGSYKITATAGTLTADAQVDVTPGKLANLEISPKSSILNISETETYTVKASDSKGNVLTGLSTDWKVIGNIGTVSQGVFTATKEGSGNVRVTMVDGTISKTADATVTVKAAKANPLTPLGFSNIMDLLMLIIGLVVLLVIVGVIVSLARRKKRKAGLQTWIQGYDGQPQPDREHLQQWMQTYDGQPPQQWDQRQGPGGPPPQF